MRLSSCPFCGGEAKLSKSQQWLEVKGRGFKDIVPAWKVFCKYCFGQTTYFRSEGEAVKAWNKREKSNHKFGYLQRKATIKKEKTNENSRE